MAGKKRRKKESRERGRAGLSPEEHAQLQVLLDRLAAQDPEGESFKQFLESLKPLLETSLSFAVAFVNALGAVPTPVDLKVVEALQKMPAEKPLRRALKKALYRLERQGVLQQEKETEAAVRVLVPRPADRQPEAWVSWPENHGERGLLVKLPAAGRAYFLAVAVLSPETGFQQLEVIQTTRKGVRTLLAEITQGAPERLIEVPLSHAGFLLEEAAGVQRRQNQPLPREYELIQREVSSRLQPTTVPLIYDLLDAEEVAADSLLLRTGDTLLDLPPFRSWRLRREATEALIRKVAELGETRLVISENLQKERMERLMREAAIELFMPEEMRQRYRRLLEEAALLLYLQGQQQEARRALAAAIDLRSEPGLLNENTFVVALVRRTVYSCLAEELEGMESRSPDQRATESGLIIPG